jgi:predicted PurR-regulated permease PerM
MSVRATEVTQTVTATAAGIALLYFLRPIILPLVLALVLAILVSAVERYVGRRSPKAPGWATVLISALLVLLAAVVAAIVTVQGAAQMVRQAPALFNRIEEIVQTIGRSLGLRETIHVTTLTGSIDVPELAGQFLGSVGDVMSGLVLMITYFIFILAGRKHVKDKLANLSEPPERATRIEAALSRISRDIETYLWVQTITGLMAAAAAAAVMFAVGLDNALFWTILLFFLSFIPILGVTVGSIVPALFALLQFPTWWQAAAIFGVIQVAAFIIGNLIYPRMQAETQNIDPVATLLSLAFWGFLWGVTGAFLAVPMTLIVMMTCSHFPKTRWVAVLLSNDGKVVDPGATLDAAGKAR